MSQTLYQHHWGGRGGVVSTLFNCVFKFCIELKKGARMGTHPQEVQGK
jgi:hypothetical protein